MKKIEAVADSRMYDPQYQQIHNTYRSSSITWKPDFEQNIGKHDNQSYQKLRGVLSIPSMPVRGFVNQNNAGV